MYTQLTCPNCSTAYSAEIHQIIDVGRQPELKQKLLSGQLNVAVCPSCGAGGQLTTILLYHDPAHDLFMLYLPQEMQLDQMQLQQYVGALTKEVLENTPMAQRRGYMLMPPTTMLTMQSFMDRVLETEGITKEIINRQRKQAELLNTMAKADTDVVEYLIQERGSEIDETFFAMLRSFVEAAVQNNNNEQLLPLINLQAKLMVETPVGRKIEKRQIAMHALNQDAKKANGLTPLILLRHVLKNQEDLEIVEAIAQAGVSALTYEFFTGLTAEIDKQEMTGKKEAVKRLTQIRADLLNIQEAMRQASEQILHQAQQELENILAANDIEKTVQSNMNNFDDAFMYVLSAEIHHATEKKDRDRLAKLNHVHELIVHEAEGQTPPEIQLLTRLIDVESEEEMQAILNENQELISADLITVIDMLQDQVRDSGQTDLVDQLGRMKRMISQKLGG